MQSEFNVGQAQIEIKTSQLKEKNLILSLILSSIKCIRTKGTFLSQIC
jgi:hypothetical protein